VKIVSGAGTGFFYLFKKTAAIQQRKIAIRKFDPIVNQYVIFNEAKLKYSTALRPAPQPLFKPNFNFTFNTLTNSYNTRNIMYAAASVPAAYFAFNFFNNQPKKLFH
jgi:large subunit ribosomal protein L33